MSVRLTVRVVAEEHRRVARVVREVVASLPESFAIGGADAAVAVVAGDAWPTAVAEAAASGARGVLVIDPLPVADLTALAGIGVPVVLSEPWAGDPVFAEAAARWGRTIDAATLVEVRVTEPLGGADPADAAVPALRQLRVLRALGAPGVRGAVVTGSPSAAAVTATGTSGAVVALWTTGTDAVADSLAVDIRTPDAAVRIRAHADRTARPATAVRTDVAGATTLPTLWETAHRAAFRRLHGAITGVTGGDDLAGFAADSAGAASLSARRR